MLPRKRHQMLSRNLKRKPRRSKRKLPSLMKCLSHRMSSLDITTRSIKSLMRALRRNLRLRSRRMKKRKIKRRRANRRNRMLSQPRRMRISLETMMTRMTLILMTFLSMRTLLRSHLDPMSSTMVTLLSFSKRKTN